MVQGNLRGIALPLLVFVALVSARPSLASEGSNSNSGDSSKDSSDSQGSNDSSDTSGDSSKDSSDSSKNDGSSERSTEKSTKNSSDDSSDETKESSRSKGGKTVTIAGAVIVLGALALGTVYLTLDSSEDERLTAEVKLERFLRRHHPAVVRDVVLSGGPVLESLVMEFNFDARERAQFASALEGSAEQTLLLESLQGELDGDHVRAFAFNLCTVARRALGDEQIGLRVAAARAAEGARL